MSLTKTTFFFNFKQRKIHFFNSENFLIYPILLRRIKFERVPLEFKKVKVLYYIGYYINKYQCNIKNEYDNFFITLAVYKTHTRAHTHMYTRAHARTHAHTFKVGNYNEVTVRITFFNNCNLILFLSFRLQPYFNLVKFFSN